MKLRTGKGAAVAACQPKHRSSLAFTLISAVLFACASLQMLSAGAQAAEGRLVQMGKRPMNINVVIGKSEDVRTDQSFIEVVVGDPDIADVSPLTDRTISILGKKIGTTRVSVYAEGKKQVGIFDIEVSYDMVRLSSELKRQFPRAHIKVSPVNAGNNERVKNLDHLLNLGKRWTIEFKAEYLDRQQSLRRLIDARRLSCTQSEIQQRIQDDQTALVPSDPHYEVHSVLLSAMLEQVRIASWQRELELDLR